MNINTARMMCLERVKDDRRLPPLAALMAIAIASRINRDTREVRVSYETLVADIGIKKRCAIGLVADLERCGHFIVEKQQGRGRWNTYKMVHDGAPFDEEKVHDDAPIRDERVHNDAPFNQEKVHDGAIKGARPRTKRCTAVHPHNNLSLLPNQEDLEEREHASEELPTVQNTAVVSKPEPRPVSRPTRKSTPFPTDPAVLEQMAAVFMQAGLQPQAELAKMRDWHLGKDRRFVDWAARTSGMDSKGRRVQGTQPPKLERPD